MPYSSCYNIIHIADVLYTACFSGNNKSYIFKRNSFLRNGRTFWTRVILQTWTQRESDYNWNITASIWTFHNLKNVSPPSSARSTGALRFSGNVSYYSTELTITRFKALVLRLQRHAVLLGMFKELDRMNRNQKDKTWVYYRNVLLCIHTAWYNVSGPSLLFR